MSRAPRLFLLGTLLLTAACQAAPPAATGPTPSPSAPAPSAGTSASSPATPGPTAARVLVTGKVYDDEGRLLPDPRIEVRSLGDPTLDQTITAIAGAFSLPSVPAGTMLTLRALEDGYTARERTIVTKTFDPDVERDPNQVDFGGSGSGAYYALSQYPEIASVTPANQQDGVSANPLVVTFRLSHPLPASERGRFGKLLQLRFQVPTNVQPSGEEIIRAGTAYGNDVATLTWNDAGTEGTFRFAAPLVTRGAQASAVTIGFDQTAAIDEWPESAQGKTLGRGRAPLTTSANDAPVTGEIAAFARQMPAASPVPSVRPSPLTLWGQMHRSTTRFSLAPDARRPKVVSAAAYHGKTGADDQIVVTFDEPIRGFPESALDGSAIKASHYRYVLGRTDTADEAKRFQESDPAKNGSSPALTPTYSTSSNNIVILRLPNGTLGTHSVFKLYVDPAVKDLAGNPVQTSEQAAGTALADHVVQGNVI